MTLRPVPSVDPASPAATNTGTPADRAADRTAENEAMDDFDHCDSGPPQLMLTTSHSPAALDHDGPSGRFLDRDGTVAW